MRSQVLYWPAQVLTDSLTCLTQQLLVIDASDHASAMRADCDCLVRIDAGSLCKGTVKVAVE